MQETVNKSMRDILVETMDARGVSLERLSQLTDIPERYLAALRDGDYEKLPPAPYVRGYLIKVAHVLNIDGHMLWEIYKAQSPLKSSGRTDRLPVNRFAIRRSLSRKAIFIPLFLVAVAVYLGFMGKDFIGTPSLEITNPVLAISEVNNEKIVLAGVASPRDKLTINDEEVIVGENGRFEKEFVLQKGANNIEFKVKRLLGREVSVSRQVILGTE